MAISLQTIKKLDDDLINKIAAGEVVERPSSVVKELVENSLDAGSTQIIISIRDGGKKLIQVTDNGRGIQSDELELAVSRHATSKITQFDDLYTLKTMGFRGEALASVGSVSQLSVASKTSSGESCEIIVHGGQVVDKRGCAQAQGTTISVKYLFYQTPARLKFLRSRETEASHITDVVIRFCLSHPHVEFKLYHDDKAILDVPVFDDVKTRVAHVLGEHFAENLFLFSAEANGMATHGFLGHPAVAVSQRSHVYFFVNGRSVTDKVLWHAMMEAYRDLLMKGRYPVLVLHLNIEEKLVDVNVHPSKLEVRFHQSSIVHGFIKDTLRRHLEARPWITQIPVLEPDSSSRPLSYAGGENYSPLEARMESERNYNFENKKWRTGNEERLVPQRQIQFGRTTYADMNPIGQFLGTYILCEARDKLVLIDQHAAHERVGFEKLIQQYRDRGIPSESLLVPEIFELKPSDAEILKNYLTDLATFGFEVEPFGGNSFALKAIPIILRGKLDFKIFVINMIEDIKQTGELTSLRDKFNHVLATMACHAQIRAHHHLTRDEMTSLLNELEKYQFTDFCPHGRPVCIEVTKEEIEKWFRRTL